MSAMNSIESTCIAISQKFQENFMHQLLSHSLHDRFNACLQRASANGTLTSPIQVNADQDEFEKQDSKNSIKNGNNSSNGFTSHGKNTHVDVLYY